MGGARDCTEPVNKNMPPRPAAIQVQQPTATPTYGTSETIRILSDFLTDVSSGNLDNILSIVPFLLPCILTFFWLGRAEGVLDDVGGPTAKMRTGRSYVANFC